MIITDYRVKSVLRTYTRQLQKAKLPPAQSLDNEKLHPASEKVVISEEARQRLVMDQLAKHAMSKVEEEKRLNDDKKDERLEDEKTAVTDETADNRVEKNTNQQD
ncbi:MAG: DVU0524 family FlgM-associated protein [Thermodesulforhabdaceae bacterium]|jgi:hypothetical protein